MKIPVFGKKKHARKMALESTWVLQGTMRMMKEMGVRRGTEGGIRKTQSIGDIVIHRMGFSL